MSQVEFAIIISIIVICRVEDSVTFCQRKKEEKREKGGEFSRGQPKLIRGRAKRKKKEKKEKKDDELSISRHPKSH